MTAKNRGRNLPPSACPYCDEPDVRIPSHLPCDAVPSTTDVVAALDDVDEVES